MAFEFETEAEQGLDRSNQERQAGAARIRQSLNKNQAETVELWRNMRQFLKRMGELDEN